MGQDSLDCNEKYSCVNCKGDHPSYSRNCQKWIKEKEIQTIRTKQNITYPEAKKIVESRTPTIGISYAAIASKTNEKNRQSIGTQTEHFNNSNSELPHSKMKPHTSNKNSKNHLEKESEMSTEPKPITPKLPLHKRTTETNSNKKSINQNRKSNNPKQISKNFTPTASHKPSKKVKTTIPTKINIKETNSKIDTELLTLHPTDTSDNEEVMSVASDSSITDTFI